MSDVRQSVLDYATPEIDRWRRVVWLTQVVLPWILLAGTFAWLLTSRMRQPGDLHDDDQSKTMTYTVDMIRNHEFAMPRDMYRQPATKPPMYNWLTVPFIYLFQSWEPWVYKLPSILAAVATCGLIIFGMRSILGGTGIRPLRLPEPVAPNVLIAAVPIGAGLVAADVFLANQPVLKNMYLCRPDMLLTAFMTGAWVCGTIALLRNDSRSTMKLAAGFWICIAGAALTKGPPALAVIAYVLLGAPLFAPDGARSLRRLHWRLAGPLLLLPLAIWIGLGFREAGKQFYNVYFDQEMISRILHGGPEKGLEAKPFWQMCFWFFTRFAPWSLLVMAVLVAVPLRRWGKHTLAPIILWTVLILIFFSIPGGKRADYLLPMYPPASMAVAYLLVVIGSWLGMTSTRAMLVICLVALYVSTYPDKRRVISSDPMETFADQIRPLIKRDPIVLVSVAGYQPLLPLLGRFDGTRPIPMTEERNRSRRIAELKEAKWVIMPVSARWTNARVISPGPSPAGRVGRAVTLALYRVGAENSPRSIDVRNMDLHGSGAVTTSEIEAAEAAGAAAGNRGAPRRSSAAAARPAARAARARRPATRTTAPARPTSNASPESETP